MRFHVNLPILRAISFIRDVLGGKNPVTKAPGLDENKLFQEATPKLIPMDTFELALNFLLRPGIEGGYSNRAGDHGGKTNYGVTQETYSGWLRGKKLPDAPVRSITLGEAHDLYFDLYWTKPHIVDLDTAGFHRLAIAVFDWGVNHGPGGAIRTLQQVLGISQDGSLGPKTLHAVKDLATGIEEEGIITNFNTARIQWYIADGKKDPTQRQFEHGWQDRVLSLESYLENLPPA